MNLKQNQKGFTIVELLIVIVVIAILAAISIVAYTGIQNRAKTSAGQSAASQVEKKAQAYYTVESTYPFNEAAFADADVPEAALEGNLTFVTMTFDAGDFVEADANSGEAIGYVACDDGAAAADQASTTGIQIAYWDFTTGASVVRELGDCTT